MTDFEVIFLGTGGTAPSADRGMPATLFKRGGTKILVDCGEGTQRQIWRAEGGLVDLDAIFLTHYHTDHILGLSGLLNSYALRGRDRPLPIYGPPPLEQNLRRFKDLMGRRTYELIEPHEFVSGEVVSFDDEFFVRGFRTKHGRYTTLGYSLIEQPRPGRFDVRKAKSLGIHPGPDFGKLQAGRSIGSVTPEMVIGPPRRGRKVSITGDTAPCDSVRIGAANADLLIHEATLLETDNDTALKTEHSTALKAAIVANDSDAKRLALYHVSPRHPNARPLLLEARRAFPGVVVPDDFNRIKLPFEV